MKHTLLIALLGATVTLATPSLSFADNGYKFKSGLDNNHSQKDQKAHARKDRRQHKNDHKRFVAKPPKPHRVIKQIQRDHNKNRQRNKQVVKNGHKNKHGYNKHGHNDHNYHNKHKNKPSFSVSWNVGDSTISYGNDAYVYDNGYQKNRGKRIYKRINRQANRIQNGINNGQLVKREVRKLRYEQRDIKQTMSHYKRDGHLNRYERSKLNHLLDVASNNIQRKSNNRRTRYSSNHDYYVQF